MYIPLALKKLEIWVNDETDLDYCYAYVRDEGRSMDLAIAEKALKHFADVEKTGFGGNLQVDFIGGEVMKGFELIRGLQDYREFFEGRSGRKMNFRVITAGIMSERQRKYIEKKGISLRNSLTSMEPTDNWWYGVKSGGDVPSLGLKSKIEKIRKTFPEFHHRLIVSRESYEIKSRVEALIEEDVENIMLVPRLIVECAPDDEPNLTRSMREYGRWFKRRLLDSIVPPVVNSKRLLYMVHRLQELVFHDIS